MPTIKTRDGTEIYYKDWGNGQPITFSHGWPLTADAWEDQMVFLASHGYRVIAHDRRGHGRSSQPWDRNEMNTYADDLAELFDKLDLKDAVMVGHSTGGGGPCCGAGLAKGTMIRAARNRKAIMYSRTRDVTDFQLATMQNGISAVVRITNGSEMPSTPI